MESDSDILIIGGGLNGPVLALALAGAGHSVTVIDALPAPVRHDPGFDGRGYALALASQRLLATLGLWPAVAAEAQPILEIRVTDGHAGQGPGPFWMGFDHAEIEEGPMGYMVEDRHLRAAVLDAVEASPNVTPLNGRQVVSQDVGPTGVTLQLDDGTSLSGRLLIGADGRGSGTATRAGIQRLTRSYGQTALVAAIGHTLPHGGTAHQFFLPEGPLAILPLTSDRSSIVWTTSTEAATELQALNDDDFLTALRPRFGDYLGDLSLAGARFSYPLGLTLAYDFTAPRVALVGDAAHGMHPIAGQGLNVGLRDIAALAEVLTDAKRRGEDIGATDVLLRYQEWRRFDAVSLAMATDGFNRLFSNDNPLLRMGRDLGMGLVQSLPGLRRTFIREAAGLSGTLPRLMQGDTL
ncbi:UbiH/UbiF/VisC/COQ6 family ubiquinone biosynthesis hydroxylase [Chachezhania antarctica]|uniref:UbiH/UbiF/VisC/COQ6 family ubiquinone biosynthesis hydroxylase n=1 Tax=Chachezhania antarctica TaxID=2340860 RepID=UPI000EB5B96E|nr:UbiH/UbiF/VisC/COQ6 family ubiquinone biosynthesis hydroxylase [Chachezhania antarctica]